MNKIAFIRKVKAWSIRLQVHRFLGPLTGLIIYAGYLSRLSRWVAANKQHMGYNDFFNSKPDHKGRLNLYEHVLHKLHLAEKPIRYIEFGVGRGNSMRWWTGQNTHPESLFWGFDTFEGLPERYGTYAEGTFSLGGNFPDIPDTRIQFVKGLFQDTLLQTLPSLDFSQLTIVHVDGDLYNSALYPLALLYPNLKPDDLIIFDEFGVPMHEFRAFEDFTRAFRMKLKPIGAINNYLQVVFQVESQPPVK